MIRSFGRRRRPALLAAALVAAAGSAGCAATPSGGNSPPPVPGSDGARVYVASQEDVTVAVLDAATGALLQTVDLKAMGYSPTAKAHHVAVEPDGSFWYVSLIADGKVLKLDRTNRLVGEADFETPGMLALDPGSDLLYVGRSMAAVNPPRRVGVIRRSTMELEEVDVFISRPHALALDTHRDRAYTASLGENRMAWLPLGEEEAELVELPGHHHMLVQFAVSPDGRWLVGGGQMSGEVLVFDLHSGDLRPAATLALGGQPWHPSFTADGSELWVPQQEANSVTVVRTADWSVDTVLTHPALQQPHGSAVSPDGRLIFVSARNTSGEWNDALARPGAVVTFDRATRQVVRVEAVGRYAAGMAAPASGTGR